MFAGAELARVGAAWAGRWSRGAALVLAGGAALALSLDPYLLSGIAEGRVHAGLPVAMLGVSLLFLYGFGFELRSRGARLACHPAVAALLVVAGVLVMSGG